MKEFRKELITAIEDMYFYSNLKLLDILGQAKEVQEHKIKKDRLKIANLSSKFKSINLLFD